MTGCCGCATTVEGNGADGLDLLLDALEAEARTDGLELAAAA